MGLNIAIVGLGRVGSEFMEELLAQKDKGVNLLCAAEISDTPGKARAREIGVRVGTMEDIIALGHEVDIIFDVTGSKTVRKMLREALAGSKNTHTVVVPETVTRLVWSLMTDKGLPEVHTHTGY